MNRIIKSLAIGVALGCAVLWCVPNSAIANPGDIVQECYTFTTTTGQDIGHNPQSGAAVKSTPFKTPINGNYSIFVTADTAGAANASDTISIAYQVGVNYSVTGSEDAYARWKTVAVLRIPKSSATVSFPMFMMFRDAVGFTAIDTAGIGSQQGLRGYDPIINTTASNESPALGKGVGPAMSTGLGRFVLYGADADSLITGAWTIVSCFNYEKQY